jgi:ubiquinone/menaquinone biosynthesis C-methylase UbiE
VRRPSIADWRSYDGIADRYDEVASPRFRAVARRMWALLPLPHGRVLDIGTGTGVVPAAGAQTHGPPSLAVGCDRAPGMLARARAEAPWLRVLVADALALPFPAQTFDIVTASFVLSHLREPDRLLHEAGRVLKPSRTMALSSWAEARDPFTTAWSESLAEAISAAEVERATREVIPSEGRFGQPGGLESALNETGFSVVASDTVDLDLAPSVEQFVDDRALTPGGRLGRSLLGEQEWARFVAQLRGALESRFGHRLRYSRRAFIVAARKRRSPASLLA